jgi:hypothetical protein
LIVARTFSLSDGLLFNWEGWTYRSKPASHPAQRAAFGMVK